MSLDISVNVFKRIKGCKKLITVLLQPIIQSYVMKGCELNKFGTCHMSFCPMNILKIHQKQAKNKNFLNFGYISAIQVDLTNTESNPPPPKKLVI
jgi:hypothetical protein